jgi:hypothetical protein
LSVVVSSSGVARIDVLFDQLTTCFTLLLGSSYRLLETTKFQSF